MSKQTQIALDFGEEPSDPPGAPPAVADGGNKAEDPARPYMTAGGVGIRIKAYKQMPSPQTGDLFGGTTPVDPIVTEAVAAPMSVAKPSEPDAEPSEPMVEPSELVVEPSREIVESPELVVAQPEPVAATQKPETVGHVPETVGQTSEVIGQLPEARVQTPVREIVPEVVVEERKPAVKDPVTKKPAARASARRQQAVKQGPSKRGRKSLKQVAAEADLIEIPADEVLFSKQYYTMGEVSAMFMVNQSLLRFWETEFDILQPKKNKKGDRYFRPIDIKNLHLIYHLLRQKKYTIEGAKEFLKNNKKAEERFEVIQRLEQIKTFLLEWKAQLG